jgi:hypothetical protein
MAALNQANSLSHARFKRLDETKVITDRFTTKARRRGGIQNGFFTATSISLAYLPEIEI